MAKVRFEWNTGCFDQLRHMADGLVAEKANEAAAAANASSTWGGYHVENASDSSRPRYRVWSGDGRNDDGRDQRLLRF